MNPASTDQRSTLMDDSVKRIGIAVVEHNGQVLVGLRPQGVFLAGFHEFPGGKCLPGESPASCAERECLEETGLQVEALALLDSRRHEYAHGSVELHFFGCRLRKAGEPAPPFVWMPIARLSQLNFPEANSTVIARLQATNILSEP